MIRRKHSTGSAGEEHAWHRQVRRLPWGWVSTSDPHSGRGGEGRALPQWDSVCKGPEGEKSMACLRISEKAPVTEVIRASRWAWAMGLDRPGCHQITQGLAGH